MKRLSLFLLTLFAILSNLVAIDVTALVNIILGKN